MRNYAPEAMSQNSGNGLKYDYTPASDLYMFGLIIWEMLNGHLVWDKCNTMQANKKVLAMELPEFEERVLGKCPKEIVEFVNECLSFDPKNRPTFD